MSFTGSSNNLYRLGYIRQINVILSISLTFLVWLLETLERQMHHNSIGPRRPGSVSAHSGPGPNPAHHLFLYGLWAKNVFYILKWLEKNQKKNNNL